MREQGGLASHRRREVTADQSEVGTEAIGRGAAGDQAVHPGTAALVFARMPVGVEGAQEDAFLVAHIVVVHAGIPGGHSHLLFHADSVEAVDEVSEARYPALPWGASGQ